jgi:AraC-like DNA-binding protein
MHTDAFAKIRATKLIFYLRCMKKWGFDASAVLRGTGLKEKHLEDIYSFIDIQSYIAVVSNMMNLTKLPELAFELGKELRPSDLGVLGHAFSACKNTVEGTQLWQKYNQLFLGNLLAADKHNDGTLIWFEYQPRVKLLPHLLQFFIEEKINIETVLFRKFNNCQTTNHLSKFSYTAPPHAKLYENLLGGNIKFEADKNLFAVEFSTQYLTKEFPGADRETLKICTDYLDKIVRTAYTNTSLSEKTQSTIRELLPRILSVNEIAKEFRYSTRTFCRGLEKEHTRYRLLVATIREDVAKNYLSTTSLSNTEIAAELGFGDVGSFRRAFKLWTDMTITEYKASSTQ